MSSQSPRSLLASDGESLSAEVRSPDREVVIIASAGQPKDGEEAPATIVDLQRKAQSQEFSAAWADEWNPNPLSEVSA